VRRLTYRNQRTIGRAVEVRGIGFLTGAMVRLRFLPAPPDCGVVFIRGDLPVRPFVPARIDHVTGTNRRTTLGRAPAQVELVEHVLAALSGLHVDNCFVELNASEPPGLDGSALGFAEALREAKIIMQRAQRPIWHAEKSHVVSQAGGTLAIHPWDEDALKISYLLDYGLHTSIPHQTHTEVITPESFLTEIACCRTFILESEAEALRAQGLGARTTAADLLVFDSRGKPIDNTLRFADEPARHKILDIIGDLALFGQDLRGHVVAYRSGHPLNAELVRSLGGQMGCGCSRLRLAA
jgi:UDP-3-O-acyl N-acetylglucosamine deacetylase